jgi:hypothetical protein
MEFALPTESPLFAFFQPPQNPFRYYLCDKTKEECKPIQKLPSNTSPKEFVV